MITSRKGLTLRSQNLNSKLDAFEKENLKCNPQKSVTKTERDSKSSKHQGSKLFIYKDESSSVCQHCGSDRSRLNKSTIRTSVSTQTSEEIIAKLKGMLYEETPSIDYWKQLAEERGKALQETLSENHELCDLVEALQAEVDRLSPYEKLSKQFINDVTDLDLEEPESN